ncbi:potassium/sodium eff, partial [Meira miltonrushii]
TTTAHIQQATTEAKIDLHRPHTLTTEETLNVFKVDFQNGLATQEAKARSETNGQNVIREAKGVSIWSIALRQVANALTVILLAAMALSFGVQDWVEGGVVSAVIVVNVVIGFVQEYKAENALASLRSLSSPTSSVIRDQGKIQEIDARQVVVGDIVHFKTGDVVPADVRIITLSSLEIDEAPLTGESVPVLKTSDALHDVAAAPLPPADRTNLAFAGTTVTKGRGAGVVVAIGMQTQIGQIAAALDKKNANKHHLKKADGSPAAWYVRAWEPVAKLLGLRDGTPLQRKLSRFALILLGLAVICAIIVFAVAEFDLSDDVILYAIALGIGVLPESLVAVLTITFSVGAKRMANSNVIVRKLEALEALGGVTDICSDKTGTLTHGKMIVDKIWTPSGRTLSVEKGGTSVLEPVGQLVGNDKEKIDNGDIDAATRQLCLAACLCNVAQIWYDEEAKQWASRGDPTEVALQVLARKVDMDREELLKSRFTFEQEHAFDSTTKRMTMMFTAKDEHDKQLFMKGAPERVLECCSTYSPANSSSDIATSLEQQVKQNILDQMETLASQGLRVLAFASRKVDVDLLRKNNNKYISSSSIQLDQPEKGDQSELAHGQLPRSEAEQDFHFVGLCGLYDPPRNETYGSVKSCQNAGIIVRMITGDHIATARAIAKEVGILDGSECESAVMSAGDFDQLSEQQIDALPTLPLVVARCSPTTKVRMIAAGARRGRLLAMTGDGINDAPALLNAPIGIAMGSGTDVAKDSAELILTDDKFDNIAKAVKEGRTVFKNIQRFMIALLVLNVAEVLLLLIGLALRDAKDDSIFPISPIGVLFLNLIAGLPAIGLGFEKAEKDVMRKPPHDLKGGVLSKQVLWDLFVYGLTMGWTCLIVFIVMLFGIGDGSLGFECNDDGPFCHNVFEARSATFTALFLQGLLIPWHLISMEQSLLRINPVKRLRSNPFLLWSVLFGIVTIPICLYVPKWNTVVFRQASLGGAGWGIALAAVAIFWLVLEAWKYFARRNHWPWLTKISGG